MHGMPRGYARYVLGVMVGINFLNYLDRYILPSVATKIQAEFHLTDSQVGLLGSAFLLVYAVATIPFGIWADRGVRKRSEERRVGKECGSGGWLHVGRKIQ